MKWPTEKDFKGLYLSKALICMKVFLYKPKCLLLSRKWMPLATLLYEQFIHLTEIHWRPSIQLFSNWQHANQTSWLFFVVSNCEFVLFPLESWVRCGAWLYRFLIFAPLLTLHLSTSYDIVSTKIYDKWDDFDFENVIFPFLDGDVHGSTSYGVYITQLIRFARACSHVADLNTHNKLLTQKLL